MGELYVWDLLFLLLGIYWLITKREKSLVVLMVWMLIAPIPAATARETPHALRILSILPTFQIIIAYGLYSLWSWLRQILSRRSLHLLFLVVCFMLSINIFYYLHDYYIHYPRDWSGEWQFGYKEMVNYVSTVENNYDHIFVTNGLGRPYIYFAFYDKMPEEEFLSKRVAQRDWFGFWDVKALGKINFGFELLPKTTGRILLVTTPNNLPSDFHLKHTIKNPKGEDIFLIAEKT